MAYKIIGTDISPFVRKVLVVAREKGIELEHDPLVPFGVSDEHKRLHPQGKIPVLLDGDRVLPDSSIICEYLERLHPEPSLYPSDPYENARAKWFEEYADSGVSQAILPYFSERVVGKLIMKREPDEAVIANADATLIPPAFDYLERELGSDDYVVAGRFSIGDIGLGSVFVNFALGDGQVDAKRWPGVAAYVERLHGRPSFKGLIEANRAAIAAMGG